MPGPGAYLHMSRSVLCADELAQEEEAYAESLKAICQYAADSVPLGLAGVSRAANSSTLAAYPVASVSSSRVGATASASAASTATATTATADASMVAGSTMMMDSSWANATLGGGYHQPSFSQSIMWPSYGPRASASWRPAPGSTMTTTPLATAPSTSTTTASSGGSGAAMRATLAEQIGDITISNAVRVLVLGAGQTEVSAGIVGALSDAVAAVESDRPSMTLFVAPPVASAAEATLAEADVAAAVARGDAAVRDISWDASVDALAGAMRDVAYLVVIPDGNGDVAAQVKAATAAAVDAGVVFVVLVSHLAAAAPESSGCEPLFAAYGAAEMALRDSGLAYTVLRSAPVLQELMTAPRLNQGRLMMAKRGGAYVDARDVGAAVGAVLANPVAHAKKTFVLTGPSVVTGPALADALGQVLGSAPELGELAAGELQAAAADDAASAAGDLDLISPHLERLISRRPATLLACIAKELSRLMLASQ
ncbi:uncharacterized protein AMSG_12084 [Thecamonas trahens ATCC 50062]|uniref:NAD(P)-binding domain-containing protein n=1 Tax=Thecamonas trahens ATCC 50062 TaxID=461836 RepID=A0A0L0DGH4_THETB|nr:hypothetical protein AMSG_12084 [Thecamonas trahens ATCC 50062]KNC51434.1 hypothetical protein AMSG_12084 [Thecamonas trahens ATCC 50062]|eukprot:XP_013756164.1 hypothetical protein AMSG_12084 [Thecamonas trahens ATCC 50062]